MMVALAAGGKEPPGARVTTLTAFAAVSVQPTVVVPSGAVATVGSSEMTLGSESVCADCHTPLMPERVCARTTPAAKLSQKKHELGIWYSNQTSVVVPSSATAS